MGWTLWLIRIIKKMYWLNHQLVEKPSKKSCFLKLFFYLLHILHIISLDEVFENSPTPNKVRFPLAVSSILLKLVGYHPAIYRFKFDYHSKIFHKLSRYYQYWIVSCIGLAFIGYLTCINIYIYHQIYPMAISQCAM